MVTVLLYGFLGRQFGRVHRYDVRSPAEAIKALSATLDGFRKALVDGGAYRVVVGGRDALELDRIANPVSSRETIRIVPVVSGAGNGLGQIVLGAALIWASGGMALLAGGALGMSAAATTMLAGGISSVGMSLVIGGVSQMLFSPPKAESGGVDRPENKPSYAFDGSVNTAAQGNPVAVCYGRLIVGSQVISAGISVEQI